jgi:hypothetical protein
VSGSRPTPAEQHLGDRLSALVDGELGHEARDRVLAHLATCPKCKAEADAQRRLKNVFAEAAPPPPSESFLARLQMLPAGGDTDGGDSPFGGGGFGGRLKGTAGGPGLTPDATDSRDFADFGVFGPPDDSFGYLPSGPHGGALSPSEGRGFLGGRGLPGGGRGLLGDRGFLGNRGLSGDRGFLGGRGGTGAGDRGFPGAGRPAENHRESRTDEAGAAEAVEDGRGTTGDRGFRIHDVSRSEFERSASRGMRFAFVAAGAVSLAAIALGGMSTGVPTETADARGGPGSGSNVTPLRTQASGTAQASEAQRRRGAVGPLLGQGVRSMAEGPLAQTSASAPLLPGVPAPAGQGHHAVHPLTTPVLAGAAVMSPLIRPLLATAPGELGAWPAAPELTAPELAAPGLLSAPDTTSSPTPTSPALR